MQIPKTPTVALLNRFAGRRWTRFAAGICLLLSALVLQRVPALFIGVALDALLLDARAYTLPLLPVAWIPASTAGQALLTVAVLGLAILAESATRWYGGLVYEAATLRTLHEIRTATYDTAASLSMTFYDDRKGGDVLSVLNDDVDNLKNLFYGARDGVFYGGAIVSAFAFMLLLNWNLALIVALLPVGIAAIGRLYASLLEPRYDAVRESIGTMNARLRDAIEGLRTVKAFTREATERDRVAAASSGYKTSKWSAIRLRAGYDTVSWFVATIGIWGLFLLGGYWILSGPPLFFTEELTPGALLTFMIYTLSFLEPTRRLAVDVIDKYENGRASSKRVADVLESDELVEEPDDAGELVVSERRVTYEDVSFAYDAAERETLTDVSFVAEPGEFVGVVGSTGAGKSTLVKLLFRFYEPDAGTVRIDGQDIADVGVEGLREHVGYVGQEPFLFHGTVGENIAYATPDAERDGIVTAAKRAGAHEFIRELDDVYETQVGERGVTLSGGQRQRVAIARALFKGPEILVFDEAMSHVDNETEIEIQRSLASTSGERTVFAIAHRLSTVRGADRILVMDDGRLVEEGTHDELVDRGGIYARLWRIQTGKIAADPDDGAVIAEEVNR